MPKLFLPLTLSLMLSERSWPMPQSSDIPKIESLLTTKQQDAIIICDRENQACHESLSNCTAPANTESEWKGFLGGAIVGALTALILAGQFHH